MRRLAFLVAMMFASVAHAYIGPAYLASSNPAAGQNVVLQIDGGVCDGFLADPPPTITRNGHALRILVQTIHAGFICNFPSGTASYNLGSFAAGTYTLQVDTEDYEFPVGDVVRTIEILPMRVVAVQSPDPAPANDVFSLLLVAMGVMVISIVALRSSQRSA